MTIKGQTDVTQDNRNNGTQLSQSPSFDVRCESPVPRPARTSFHSPGGVVLVTSRRANQEFIRQHQQ